MKNKILFISSFFYFVFYLLFPNISIGADKVYISIPPETILETIGQKDRIAEYKISISSGRIYSIIKIEEDWWFEVKNEHPHIKAFALHGTGGITVDEVRKGVFDNFIVIEHHPEWGSLDINIDLTIDVFMKNEFKHLTLKTKDILVVPVTHHEIYKPGEDSTTRRHPLETGQNRAHK